VLPDAAWTRYETTLHLAFFIAEHERVKSTNYQSAKGMRVDQVTQTLFQVHDTPADVIAACRGIPFAEKI
jgi:hypothetical protein